MRAIQPDGPYVLHVFTGKDGSSTTIFHSIFRPGSTHAKHLHSRCDEIAVYLKGHGTVGQSGECTEVGPGHCRLMPKGSVHFFHNESKDEEGLVIVAYEGDSGERMDLRSMRDDDGRYKP